MISIERETGDDPIRPKEAKCQTEAKADEAKAAVTWVHMTII